MVLARTLAEWEEEPSAALAKRSAPVVLAEPLEALPRSMVLRPPEAAPRNTTPVLVPLVQVRVPLPLPTPRLNVLAVKVLAVLPRLMVLLRPLELPVAPTATVAAVIVLVLA